jgi:ABC-type phosphate transport system auxiliary subunit
MQVMLVVEMTALLDEITAVISDDEADRAQIERTLTDGYAHALTLESERLRLEKRIAELAGQRGSKATQEVVMLNRELDGTAGDLAKLRSTLAELRKRR